MKWQKENICTHEFQYLYMYAYLYLFYRMLLLVKVHAGMLNMLSWYFGQKGWQNVFERY